MTGFMQILLHGVETGALYALVAVGFALIFGVTRRLHLAHGAAFCLAGYAFVLAMGAGWAWPLAALAALLAATGFGLAAEALVYRPIDRHQGGFLPIVAAGVGLFFLVQWAVGLLAGTGFAHVATPFSGLSEVMPHVWLAQSFWLVIGASALLLGGFGLFVQMRPLGRMLAAMARGPAPPSGARRGGLAAFAIGSALTAPAAVLMAMTGGLADTIGLHVMMIALAAVVAGGVGSFKGAATFGLLLGIAESVCLEALGPQWAEGAVFVLFFAALALRPMGAMRLIEAR